MLSRDTTTSPDGSCLKPMRLPSRSKSGTGCPASVPTPTVCTTTPALFARRTADSTSPSRSSPSETSTITLLFRSLFTNRSSPFASPEPSDVPGAGTMPGSMVSRNSPMASASSVSGTSGYASPSNATRPKRSPSRRPMSADNAWRARKNRLGGTSSVAIEPDVSSTRTTSTPSRSTFSRTIPHCGRASARTSPRTPSSTSARRTKRHGSAGRCSTRPHSGRATSLAKRSRSRRVSHASSHATSGSASRPRNQSGVSKIMPASRRSHAQAHHPQRARQREDRGRCQEHREVQLAVAAKGRELDLGLLEVIDAIEDVAQRS